MGPRLLPLLLMLLCLGTACGHVVDERTRYRRSPDEAFDLNVRRAWNLYEENLYESSLRRYDAALDAGRSFPETDPRLLTTRVARALVLSALGRDLQAEGELRAILVLQARATGERSEPVAGILNNLGVVYLDLERYDRAAQVLLTAGRIRSEVLGATDPLTAITLQNFATSLRHLGRYSEAQPAYEEALAIYRAAGPEWRTRAAAVFDHLGLLFRAIGEDSSAEAKFLSAISLTEKVNATRNPNLATYSRDLASLYMYQGRFKEAGDRYLTALEMFERTLGESSPLLHETLFEYADLLAKTGRLRESLDVRDRASTLRNAHPPTER